MIANVRSRPQRLNLTAAVSSQGVTGSQGRQDARETLARFGRRLMIHRCG